MAISNSEMIDKITDAIQAKLDGGAVASYSINGRSLTNTSLTELYELLRKFKAQAAAESADTVHRVKFEDPI